MKFLGLDYGIKRIGVALSDTEGKLAFPKKNIFNDSNTFKNIGELIKNQNIEEIVIGESLNLESQPNALQARIEVFITELEKRFKIPVHKQKEFLTTVEARRPKAGKVARDAATSGNKQKNKNSLTTDASAAALILQRYLDKLNNPKT